MRPGWQAAPPAQEAPTAFMAVQTEVPSQKNPSAQVT
jgi:hypothetical protein